MTSDPPRPDRGDNPCGKEIVARYLGGEIADEPTSAQLVAFLAGELERGDAERALVAEFAATHPGLVTAIRAGLAVPTAASTGQVLRLSDVRLRRTPTELVIEAPAFALAAEDAEQAPLPEDRQALLDEPGRMKIVYFRRAGRARLVLFPSGDDTVARLVSCTLDGVSREIADEADGQGVDLGLLGPLDGKALELRFEFAGECFEANWTLTVSGLE